MVASPLRDVNATDEIISSTARHIHAVDGRYEAMANKTIYAYPISVNGTEEQFFLRYVSGGMFCFSSSLCLCCVAFVPMNGTTPRHRVQRVNDGYGVDWWLVITLDREYMLGDIDRSTLAAQERIRDEVDSVDEKLVRSRIILVVTVVVASVLLMLLALMLVFRIVAPLVQLQEEMARVAVMNLSQVDETRAISNIEEVGHMQTSFLQMLRNLKEYRNYMPASVLVEDVSRTETETEEESDLDKSQTSHDSLSKSSGPASPTAQHGFLTMQKLDQKKVALSVVNVRDFFEALRELPSGQMQARHTEYLSTVLSITQGCNGVNDGFSGDRVLTHWNGARHCSAPKLQAAKFSHGVRTHKTLLAQKWRLSMAFVCAEVRCGNMGCEGMKKYTFLGGCVPWLHALERLNKTYGTTILHDNIQNTSVSSVFYSKTVACVSYPKLRARIVLSELHEEMVTQNEEWMYQLDKCAAANPYECYNAAMAHVLAAHWDDAAAAAEKLGDTDRAEFEKHCTAARAVCETEYQMEPLLPVADI